MSQNGNNFGRLTQAVDKDDEYEPEPPLEAEEDVDLHLPLDLPDADDCVYGDLFDDSDFSFDEDDGGEDDNDDDVSISIDGMNRGANSTCTSSSNNNAFDDIHIDEPIMDGRMAPKQKKTNPDENLEDGTTSTTAATATATATVEEYILGTLIVRVAAARDLRAVSRGRGKNMGMGAKIAMAASRRNIFRGAYARQPTSSPYAKISFGSQVQRTSTMYDTINPSWPRSDQSYLDVTLPVPNLAQVQTQDLDQSQDDVHDNGNGDGDGNINTNMHAVDNGDKDENKASLASSIRPKTTSTPPLPSPPKPILTVSIFHTDTDVSNSKVHVHEHEPIKKQSMMVHTNDEFLGLASIDVTPVLTGKTPCMDLWLPLVATTDEDYYQCDGGARTSSCSSSSGGNSGNGSANTSAHGKSNSNSNHHSHNHNINDNGTNSSVRVIIEYEAAESPPRPGDLVRFTGFVNPLDLFPLPNSNVFKVEDVGGRGGSKTNNHNYNHNEPAAFQKNEDEVVLSYYTSIEHWKCTFQVHRYMLISVERHVTALERYQEELLELTDKLSHSPAAEVVSNTMKNIEEEGILVVGLQAAVGSMSLMGRWMNGGIGTAIDDIVYATNLDGKHTSSMYAGTSTRASMNDTMSMDDTNNNDYGTDEIDMNMSMSSVSGSVNTITSDAHGHGHGHDDNLSYATTDDVSITSSGTGTGTGTGTRPNPNPNMPCCPISGQPMRDPVVAADGHTYERKSILRWFRDSDMSPLTGMRLHHKELVPNFLLISTFSSTGGKQPLEESSQITQC